MASRFPVMPVSGLVDRAPGGTKTAYRPDPEAIVTELAPRVPWDVFYTEMDWRQGEHVALVGPTGQGKTTLTISLLEKRDYVAVFGTKPHDDTMDALIASGYYHLQKWETISTSKYPRRVIWPNYIASRINSEDEMAAVFDHAYSAAFRERGWCICIDEGWYMSKPLKLEKSMRTVWTQGRSLGISHVVATQRPAWVPTEMWDQSTHLFIWRNNDDRAIQRISEIGTVNGAAIRYIIPRLEQFQCLYINTRTGDMARTRAPAPLRSPV
jgi:hypothetical protein